MARMRKLFWTLMLTTLPGISLSQDKTEIPELSSILSLFSAHAGETGIRVNWSLDRQAANVHAFRIYRGYAAAGHFAVLAELNPHGLGSLVEYAYADTSAIPGVTYYYKLAALGQVSESVFPVVISAAAKTGPDDTPASLRDPARLLPGERVSLYVRKPGRVTLTVTEPEHRALVDDVLSPGVYEFDPPSGGTGLTITLAHEDGYRTEVVWPVR